MLDAASIAGLSCVNLVSDLRAVAAFYGFYSATRRFLEAEKENKPLDPFKVMFIDVGYSDTNVAIVEYPDKNSMKVLAHTSDNKLGGRDIDLVVANWLCDAFQKEKVLTGVCVVLYFILSDLD